MKTILTILKKEFARIFKDRRLLLSLLLPGILIYCIYSLLGGAIGNIVSPSENDTYTVAFLNLPDSIGDSLNETGKIETKRISADQTEETKAQVESGKIDALFVFPEVLGDEPTDTPQQILAFYSSVDTKSAAAFSLVSEIVLQRQIVKTNFFIAGEDVASEKDLTAMMFSMIAPMLLITFLFAGCMSLVPESIAGEKERGVFATMLVTPVKRSHIALGKILALSAASLVSGACSFLGLILSLPKMLEGSGESLHLSAAAYPVSSYVALFLVIVSTVLFITAIMSVCSAFAKSVKEANSYVGPMMLIVMMAAVLNIFLSDKIGSWAYFIPLFNSVKVMGDVFSFTAKTWQIAATIVSNVCFSALLAFALAKMFDSEKIISGS